MRFPAYTAKEMKNVFRRRMRKVEEVQVFDPEALQFLFDQASCHTSEHAMLYCCCLQCDADMMWVIEHLHSGSHWISCFSFCDGAAVNVGFDCDVAIYTTPLYGCVA